MTWSQGPGASFLWVKISLVRIPTCRVGLGGGMGLSLFSFETGREEGVRGLERWRVFGKKGRARLLLSRLGPRGVSLLSEGRHPKLDC